MYNIDTWWDYPEDMQSQVLNVKQKCEKICSITNAVLGRLRKNFAFQKVPYIVTYILT